MGYRHIEKIYVLFNGKRCIKKILERKKRVSNRNNILFFISGLNVVKLFCINTNSFLVLFCQKHNTMNLLFVLFFYFFFHPHIYYRACIFSFLSFIVITLFTYRIFLVYQNRILSSRRYIKNLTIKNISLFFDKTFLIIEKQVKDKFSICYIFSIKVSEA